MIEHCGGDDQYLLLQKDWSNSDFNQAVTFASGFRTYSAAVISFSTGAIALPRPVSVGEVKVKAFSWGAGREIDPIASASLLSAELREWLYETNG